MGSNVRTSQASGWRRSWRVSASGLTSFDSFIVSCFIKVPLEMQMVTSDPLAMETLLSDEGPTASNSIQGIKIYARELQR